MKQTIPGGIVSRLIVHFHLSVVANGLTKKSSILAGKAARKHSRRKKKFERSWRTEADYEAHTTAANKNRFSVAGHAGKQRERETLLVIEPGNYRKMSPGSFVVADG